jgi:RNA polymerase sigma-32 factor
VAKPLVPEFTAIRTREKKAQRPTTKNSPYFRDLRRHAIMTRDQEHEVATLYRKTGDKKLAHRLVAANLRLVVKIANECARPGMALDDLIQEGNLGLLHAVQKFNPSRGIKLATYSAWWIRAYVYRFILANARLVKVGTTNQQRRIFFGLRRTQDQLEREAAGAVDDGQLADALRVRPRDISEMKVRMGRYDSSLDDTYSRSSKSGGKKITIGETIAAPDTWRPDAAIEQHDAERIRRELADLTGSLNEREAAIFDRRIMAEDPCTLAELAEPWGLSRERVRQIEAKLLEKLRRRLSAAMPDLAAA